MQRLFVAIVPPPDIIDRLVDIQWGVRRARWTSPDQLHLTLRFVGEVRDDEAAALEQALRRVPGRPMTLQVKGVGYFPPKGPARALWAGLESADELRELFALRARIDGAFAALGLARDPRRFVPHITLARLRHAQEESVADWIVGRSLFSTPPFAVNHIVLMRSVLQRSGSEYEVVARVPLREIP